MPFEKSLSFIPWRNKPFLFFLVSQGISNIGDTFHLIASAMLLLKLTGSGLSAGFGLICASVPGVLISTFAGLLGDKLREKHLLITLDLLRGILVMMFTWNISVRLVYVLIFSLSCLSALYNPPSKKIVVNILKERDIIAGNSLLSGVSGVAYLAGPGLAGIVIGMWGTKIGFFINSLSFIFSALMITFIRTGTVELYCINYRKKTKKFLHRIFAEVESSFHYYRKSYVIKEIVTLNTVVCLVTASVNLAFYSFAFDTLGVTSKGWGVMMSVIYGANLVAMMISLISTRGACIASYKLIYSSIAVVSAVWFGYGISNSIGIVLLLMFVEGTAASLYNILLGSQLQLACDKNYIGRITGVNDVLNSAGKLLGIGCTYILLYFHSIRVVFIINAVILLVFIMYKLSSCMKHFPKGKMKKQTSGQTFLRRTM